jgi:hypothetical protein
MIATASLMDNRIVGSKREWGRVPRIESTSGYWLHNSCFGRCHATDYPRRHFGQDRAL